MNPRVKAVVGVAVVGLSAVAGAQFYAKWKFQERLKQEGHYLKAVQIMNGYEPIKDFLGHPIKVKWFNMRDPANMCDGKKVHFSFPVSGSKRNGGLFYWGSRDSYEDEWQIDKVDFIKCGLGEDGKRWTFYLRDNQSTNKSEE